MMLLDTILPCIDSVHNKRPTDCNDDHDTRFKFTLPKLQTSFQPNYPKVNKDRTSLSASSTYETLPEIPNLQRTEGRESLVIIWRVPTRYHKPSEHQQNNGKKKVVIFDNQSSRQLRIHHQSSTSFKSSSSQTKCGVCHRVKPTSGKSIIVSPASTYKCSMADTLFRVDTADRRSYIRKMFPDASGSVALYVMPIFFQKLHGVHHEALVNLETFSKAPTRKRLNSVLRSIVCEEYHNKDSNPDVMHCMSQAVKEKVRVRPFFLRHPQFLSVRIHKELLEIKEKYETNATKDIKSTVAEKLDFSAEFKKTFGKAPDSILKELEIDLPSYFSFYGPMIEERSHRVLIPAQILFETNLRELDRIILEESSKLEKEQHQPGGSARFNMMTIIGASEFNRVLLRRLSHHVDLWFDGLLKGLQSPLASVREEACSALCFLTRNFLLMREFLTHRVFDIFHDFMLSSLRTMELKPEAGEEYYIVISHVMHYCPSISMLETLLDRVPTFHCSLMTTLWPRLVYYAYKYWPEMALGVNNERLTMRMINCLERAHRNPMTRKFARTALFHFCRRTRHFSPLFTIHPGTEIVRPRKSVKMKS